MSEESGAMNGPRYKILVLDDERFILVTIKACLKGANYDVVTVDNVQSALAEFKQSSFDLVITDILMDSIDGFKFRDLIRGYNTRIPILFLTSLLDDIDNSLLSRITRDPYSYYLNKAFTKKTLLDMLEQALSAYKSAGDLSELQHTIDQDLTLASQVQRMMLPNWCFLNKWYSAAYLYEPLLKVSGDMFEWIELGEGRCLGVIGDIAGHGMNAALCMAPIQMLVKGMQTRQDEGLQVHKILNELNSFLCTHFSGHSYMTCLVSLWDFKNNTLVYQTAGHPGLICLDTGNFSVVDINPDNRGNMPLGMAAKITYSEQDNVEVHFTEDMAFLGHTDGLMDIGSQQEPDNFLGQEALLDLVSSLGKVDNAVSIPYRLRNAIVQIGFDLPSDDVFLLAVKKNLHDHGKSFTRSILPTLEAIDDAVAEAGRLVSDSTGDVELSCRIELLLSEFLANIVVHGLDMSSSQRKLIILTVRMFEDYVRVNVLDHGKFWDYQQSTSGVDADSLLDELNDQRNTSGRGLPIILRIAESIKREHFSGLNDTTFVIRKKTSEAQEEK